MLSIGRGGDNETWNSIREIGNSLRGGDLCKHRGKKGVWHRWHTTPRAALFTPYRVSKGPASNVSLQPSRFTCGVTQSGQSFEFYDDWTRPHNQHRVLSEPWVGFTIFSEKEADNLRIQEERSKQQNLRRAAVWADEEDE